MHASRAGKGMPALLGHLASAVAPPNKLMKPQMPRSVPGECDCMAGISQSNETSEYTAFHAISDITLKWLSTMGSFDSDSPA